MADAGVSGRWLTGALAPSARSVQLSAIWNRGIRAVALFIVGLAALDQTVLVLGNRAAASTHGGSLLTNLAAADQAEYFVLGDCRAALTFDSRLIGRLLQSEMFNAGVVVDGLGSMDVALEILIAHHDAGKVLLVVDSGNWEETLETATPEVQSRLPWWRQLPIDRQRRLDEQYRTAWPLLHSGLWRYKGQGDAIVGAGYDALRSSEPAVTDGYRPRDANQNIASNLRTDADAIRASIRTSINPTSFARATIESLVQRTLEAGLTPVLVVAPMHRYWGTDAMERQHLALLTDVGDKFGVTVLNYWDNADPIANDDTLWSDTGHVNRLGAEAASRRLASDLATRFPPTR